MGTRAMGGTARIGGASSCEGVNNVITGSHDTARLGEAARWLGAHATGTAQSRFAVRVLITALGSDPHSHALSLAREIAGNSSSTAGNGASPDNAAIRATPSAILIDTSQGAVALSALLRVARAPGLAELCQYRARFEEVIQRDLGSRLHFIAAGKPRAVGGPWGEPGVADRIFRALDASYRLVMFCAEAAEAVQLAENLHRPFSAGVIFDFTNGREERLAALFESFGFPLFTVQIKA